ncbi:MAG: TonB-dependent receptor, partial [Rhodospirillaceae bacterium]|nr:TonB-dependent receptor [Rhodospirillaceae bacterium]
YFSLAADSVRNPATGGVAGKAAGTPVCRSTLTNPTNNCVPANIFGTGLLAQESIDYITGVSQGFSPAQQDIDLLQEVYALDVQYEPFSTWAGPVSTAVGIERRREKYTSAVDRASSMGLWFGGGFTPSTGRFTVLEYYGETIVPLLRDAPLVKSLDINGAVRRTDYSTSGKVTTWKAGATWEISDELRTRGTASRDIRAPNMLELFNGGVATVAQTRDPTQAGSPQVFTRQITGGNPLLKPEIAKTWTFGAVYRPEWFEGFSTSVDYYKINVRDAITTVTGQQIVDQCFGVGVPQNPAACNSIIRANTTNLVDATIYTGGLNAQRQKVEGLDFEVSYRMEMGDYIDALPGSLDLRLLASRKLKSQTLLAGALTNQLGIPTDGPKWRGLLSASYLQGPSRTTLSFRYLGSGVLNNWPAGHPQSIAENHYDSITYVELAQNYDLNLFGVDMTLFGVIENLLDSDPPPIPSAGLQSIGADSLHDLLGRSYRIGLRYKF